MSGKLSEKDKKLIAETRGKYGVDLVLDTTDSDWLHAGRDEEPKKEQGEQ